MSENTENIESSTPEPTEQSAPESSSSEGRQYSEIEQRALEAGWVPKEEYQGTKKWRDAEEFLERGELFSKIDEVGRRNRMLESALGETKKHLIKVRETEYARALQTLRAEKKIAYQEGDLDRVEQLDDQIAQTRDSATKEINEMQRAPVQPGPPNPQFVAWVNKNSWYESDRIMKAAADAIADDLVTGGETNPTRVLQEVEKRIKAEFPQKFRNPNRDKPGQVESGGRQSSGRKESFQLTPEESRVMEKLVRAKVMTRDEYIADIKASRGA